MTITDPIPDEAVEAALDTIVPDEAVLGPEYREMFRDMVVSILTAAAPHIVAQATGDLRAGIEALRDEWRAEYTRRRSIGHFPSASYASHADALDALLREGE